MDTIFGRPLDELTWGDVATFLEGQSVEPLTWEGKADDARGKLERRDIVKAIAAFANSERGGYLILGARQRADRVWEMPGLVQPPHAELLTWVSQLANQVSPRPAVDGRDLEPPDGRGPAAVVWIPPIDEPPAITADGGVYIRVAGASDPVRDPRVLGDLYGRGVTARANAEVRSLQALNNESRAPTRYLSAGAAALGGHDRTDTGIYSRAFLDALLNIAHQTVGSAFIQSGLSHAMSHEKSWIRIVPAGGLDDETRIELIAHRNGAVGVHHWAPWAAQVDSLHVAIDDQVLRRTSAAIFRTLKLLGSSGRARVTFSASRDRPGLPGHHAVVARWWDNVEPPTDDGVASVLRDLRRTAGRVVLEPD
jgi:hypothetical protein